MVRIRLRRVGRKKQPSYRIVVADSRSPRDGRYIEVIGFYNPRTQPATMTIKEDRALYWLSNGAQPSDPVRRILDKLGTLSRFERLRQGEPVEALVAEAEQQFTEAETPSPRTAYAAHEIQRLAAPKTLPAAKAEAPAEPEAEAPEEPPVEPEAEAETEEAVEAEAIAETEEAVEAEAMADVQDSPTPEAAAEAAESAEETALPEADEAKPEVGEVGETTEEEDEEPPAAL